MADIWDRIARALDADVDSQLWQLRQSPTFLAMGSELERAFAAAFEMSLRIGDRAHFIGTPTVTSRANLFFLEPQVVVGSYRVDFVFGITPRDLAKCIAIECDGHDFHERTKDQAARDKKRDRFLVNKFGRVLHFTGSEIYRDPAACWIEVLDSYSKLHGVAER